MLPYFETLLDHLDAGETAAQQAFARHVHWGYWDHAPAGPVSPAQFHRAAEAMLRRIVDAADARDRTSVVDIGCGLGGTIEFLNREYSSCTLVGLNIDRRQLEFAAKATTAGNGNAVCFVQADACVLPFGAARFDTALCVESIFHFPSRRLLFRECERLLKPGGVLVVSDFVPLRHLGVVFDAAERLTGLVGKMYGPFDTDISIPQYRALAQAAGLECTAIEDITANTLPTYRFLRDNLHLTSKRAAYTRATRLVELVSRLRLVRYLVVTFRKPLKAGVGSASNP